MAVIRDFATDLMKEGYPVGYQASTIPTPEANKSHQERGDHED